ncbi:Tfp pilus assembly protein FimT/FimU [Patescibacteria group bacterium]
MKFKTYSIIELTIVIGIIAILTAITVPLLGSFAPQTRLNGDAKIILSSLRKAQQLSITGQRRYGIDFYPEDNKYTLFRRDVNGGVTITDIETINLSSGINISEINFDDVEQIANEDGYIRIQFNSFGAPRNSDDNDIHAEIIINNQKNATLNIDVRKNTGHVKIL